MFHSKLKKWYNKIGIKLKYMIMAIVQTLKNGSIRISRITKDGYTTIKNNKGPIIGFITIVATCVGIYTSICTLFPYTFICIHPPPPTPAPMKTAGEPLEWLSDGKTELFVNKPVQVNTDNDTTHVIKICIRNPTDHPIYVDFFDSWLANTTYFVRIRHPVSKELAPGEELDKYVKNTDFSPSGPTRFNVAIYLKDNGKSLYNVHL